MELVALLRSLFLLFALFSCISATSTNFITSSCAATRYPALCVRSLSAYANAIQHSPKQLAQTALAVSLARARSASSFASKLAAGANGLKKRDRAALKDCLYNIRDSVDELARSTRELSRIGRSRSSGFMWHVSNVQTWVSAALTDEYTCAHGLAEKAVMNGSLKVALRRRMVDVAHVTSNALALVNRYAAQYAQNTTTVAKP